MLTLSNDFNITRIFQLKIQVSRKNSHSFCWIINHSSNIVYTNWSQVSKYRLRQNLRQTKVRSGLRYLPLNIGGFTRRICSLKLFNCI